MSGGVRNLRAMFENKDATSPPDRGRSPGASVGASSAGTSPRPLSKVRTSFVTVERSGQAGVQMAPAREPNGEPSISARRASFRVDEKDNPKETAQRKESIAAEIEARKQSIVITETIPETAVANSPPETSNRSADMPSMKPETVTYNHTNPISVTNGHTKSTSSPISAPKTAERPKTIKAGLVSSAPKPAPISTSRTTVASKTTSSPKIKTTLTKTPTTPKNLISKEPATVPDQKESKDIEKKPSRASLKPSTHTTKATDRSTPIATQARTSKSRVSTSPPQTGFHKPRPKSPTRPVKLPASLTAHTASSGSKTAVAGPPSAGRQSLSRASGNSQQTSTATRSPSRATTASKPLGRTAPMIRSVNSRPSLGPPPSSHSKKETVRQSLPPAAADNSFLARMMRPTTASASKTAEKTPLTPPKSASSSARLSAKDSSTKHQEPGKAVSGSSKKEIVPKRDNMLTTGNISHKEAESKKVVESKKELKAKTDAVPQKEVVSKKEILVPKEEITPEKEVAAEKEIIAEGSPVSTVESAPSTDIEVVKGSAARKESVTAKDSQPHTLTTLNAPETTSPSKQVDVPEPEATSNEVAVLEEEGATASPSPKRVGLPASTHLNKTEESTASATREEEMEALMPPKEDTRKQNEEKDVKPQESSSMTPHVSVQDSKEAASEVKTETVSEEPTRTAEQHIPNSSSGPKNPTHIEESEPSIDKPSAAAPLAKTKEEAVDVSKDLNSAQAEPDESTVTSPSKTEAIPAALKSPKSPNGTSTEDPEDARAREEIAQLNAELLKGAEVD